MDAVREQLGQGADQVDRRHPARRAAQAPGRAQDRAPAHGRGQQVLAVEGCDPVYGARPLKRAIRQKIVQPLAIRLLRGDLSDGDTIVVDVRNGELDFTRGEARVPVTTEA